MGSFGPKRRKLLHSSWAGLFQQHILPELPVELLRRHYHDCHGRPSKELYAMMGLMVLQQMHDCTDQEAVEIAGVTVRHGQAHRVQPHTGQAGRRCVAPHRAVYRRTRGRRHAELQAATATKLSRAHATRLDQSPRRRRDSSRCSKGVTATLGDLNSLTNLSAFLPCCLCSSASLDK